MDHPDHKTDIIANAHVHLRYAVFCAHESGFIAIREMHMKTVHAIVIRE